MSERGMLDRLIDMALDEDVGPGDWTSEWTVDAAAGGAAEIVAKEELVVAGRLGRANDITGRLEGTLNGIPWSKEYRFSIGANDGGNGFIPQIWAALKIDALTLQFNRARQAAITKELVEIVSGAEAL